MSQQLTFGDAEYAGKRKPIKRERFLAEMDRVAPWAELIAVIGPFWPKGERGRPPFPLETMLRIHLMQQWYALSGWRGGICWLRRDRCARRPPRAPETRLGAVKNEPNRPNPRPKTVQRSTRDSRGRVRGAVGQLTRGSLVSQFTIPPDLGETRAGRCIQTSGVSGLRGGGRVAATGGLTVRFTPRSVI
jgi:IS5 family transposase